MDVDIARLKVLARQARQGTTGEWTWDDGTLIELDHEDPIGIQVTQAKGSPVAPFIAAADPKTVLTLIEELESLRETVSVLSDPEAMVAVGEALQELEEPTT